MFSPEYNARMSVTVPLTVVGWVITLIFTLIGSNIAIFLWTSRRELEKNDRHKKEMEKQQEKFLLLHIEVINERINAVKEVTEKNEVKSEKADDKLEESMDLRRRNEYTLFKQDEHARNETFDALHGLKTELATLEGKLQERRSIGKDGN